MIIIIHYMINYQLIIPLIIFQTFESGEAPPEASNGKDDNPEDVQAQGINKTVILQYNVTSAPY